MNNIQTKKGFTLIEILIVVSIIGLLSSIIFVGLASSRARGRDARRIADLRSIQTGLELYFTKNGKYPDNTASLVGAGAGLGIVKIPTDPSAPQSAPVAYVYEVNAAKTQYLLVANTEASAGDTIYSSSAQAADLPGFTNATGCGSTKYCVSF